MLERGEASTKAQQRSLKNDSRACIEVSCGCRDRRPRLSVTSAGGSHIRPQGSLIEVSREGRPLPYDLHRHPIVGADPLSARLHSRISITAKPCISSMRSIVYHQHEVLYLIKPQEKYTLTRDEIQRRLAAFDDIQPQGADDIPSLRLG